jgi:hypothetical protein
MIRTSLNGDVTRTKSLHSVCNSNIGSFSAETSSNEALQLAKIDPINQWKDGSLLSQLVALLLHDERASVKEVRGYSIKPKCDGNMGRFRLNRSMNSEELEFLQNYYSMEQKQSLNQKHR